MIKKVLIVDDDEAIVDAITILLEDTGYQVESTFNGEETFQKIHSFKPDILLLDVLISGSDGRDICNKLKKQRSKIPIIMISAHPSAMQGAQGCDAYDFLAKPFETQDLLNKVSKLSQNNLS